MPSHCDGWKALFCREERKSMRSREESFSVLCFDVVIHHKWPLGEELFTWPSLHLKFGDIRVLSTSRVAVASHTAYTSVTSGRHVWRCFPCAVKVTGVSQQRPNSLRLPPTAHWCRKYRLCITCASLRRSNDTNLCSCSSVGSFEDHRVSEKRIYSGWLHFLSGEDTTEENHCPCSTQATLIFSWYVNLVRNFFLIGSLPKCPWNKNEEYPAVIESDSAGCIQSSKPCSCSSLPLVSCPKKRDLSSAAPSQVSTHPVPQRGARVRRRVVEQVWTPDAQVMYSRG